MKLAYTILADLAELFVFAAGAAALIMAASAAL